jgi:hypothetical protein
LLLLDRYFQKHLIYLKEVNPMAFKSGLLWQNDPKWASEKLGFGPQTIKEWGCLMTSLCMVANGYGYKETPSTFNQKLKNAGGFQGAMVIPASVPSVFPGVVFQDYLDCEKVPAPVSRIDQHLAAGNPAVIQVDWSSAPGAQSHWVVAYQREGDDYLILDPYMYGGDAPGKQLKMLDRYKYQGKDLTKAITGVIFMTGSKGTGGTPASPPKKEKVSAPKDALIVYAAADLAVRADPNVGGFLHERLKEDDKLTVLEAKATAQGKVGQYNQWLHIQAPSGQQGYVAAWYTATEKGKAGEPSAPAAPATPPAKTGGTPPSAGTALIVTPTQEGVAFRSQPVVADNTLIKRLPFTSQLQVLEPAATAAKKIGVVNQWLKVKEVGGGEGYIAAWYVTDTKAQAIGVKDANRPAATGRENVVYASVDQLALRSQPVVADNTLIKYLSLQADLLVLEPNWEGKVGVQNQWLKVKDLEGTDGYVAAWYVTK